jgi:anti-sigma regulatory factor (Ser/Thr protein kinase)
MVSEARKLATATFASWDMHPDQVDLALLLVSEVVTNAVLHASVTPSPAGRRFDLELDPLADTPLAGVNVGALTPGSGFPMAAHYAPVYRPREFTIRLRRGAESVWVEVFDPDLRLPRLRTARATDEGGRGLYLVEQLATRWGSRPTPEGKAVWFEIPLDGKTR